MNYEKEIQELVRRVGMTKTAASKAMGFNKSTYYIKENKINRNKFTEKNYNKLVEHLRKIKI